MLLNTIIGIALTFGIYFLIKIKMTDDKSKRKSNFVRAIIGFCCAFLLSATNLILFINHDDKINKEKTEYIQKLQERKTVKNN